MVSKIVSVILPIGIILTLLGKYLCDKDKNGEWFLIIGFSIFIIISTPCLIYLVINVYKDIWV